MSRSLKSATIVGVILVAIALLLYPVDILGIWSNLYAAIANPSFGALLTIGSLIIVFAQLIYPFLTKPRLQYEPQCFSEAEKYLDQFDYKKVTFWILVKNVGKSTAKECHAEIMFQDHLGNIVEVKTGEPRLGEFFAVPWLQNDIQSHSVNIIPNKQESFAKVKLPFHLILATKKEDVLGDKHLPSSIIPFDPPIANWQSQNIIQPSRGFTVEVDMVLRVAHEAGQFQDTKFMIRMPFGMKVITEVNAIKFTASD